MNRATARKQAEIKLAWADGKQIQFKPLYHPGNWEDANGEEITFNFDSWEFRVKPDPIEEICYLVLCNGLHDGYFATQKYAFIRANELRGYGKKAVVVELKGTYTCDT